MSTGEIIFMVSVIAVAILAAILKNKATLLGFGLMLAVCVVNIISSVVTKDYKSLPPEIAFALAVIIAWIIGATSKVEATNDNTLSGVVTNIRWWGWLIIAALIGAGLGISAVVPS